MIDEEELQVQLTFDTISTSQLSRKLGDLSPTLFEKIFHYLALNIQAKMKQSPIIREIGDCFNNDEHECKSVPLGDFSQQEFDFIYGLSSRKS
jgi:hypothetical protein